MSDYTIDFAHLLKAKPFTAEEEQKHFATYKAGGAAGELAKRDLIKHNMRLVVKNAHLIYRPGLGLPLADLVQEGVFGLMRAIELFDPARQLKFSSYAVPSIQRHIWRAVQNTSKPVRMPSHLWQRQGKIFKAARDIEVRTNEAATPEQLAAATGLSVDKILSTLAADVPVMSTDDAAFYEPAQDAGDCPVMGAEKSLLRDAIQQALAHFKEPERQVVELRFGLNGGQPHTLEEISDRLGYSKEYIRNIQDKALKRLKQLLIDWEDHL